MAQFFNAASSRDTDDMAGVGIDDSGGDSSDAPVCLVHGGREGLRLADEGLRCV